MVLKHLQVFAHENWEGLSNWLQNYRPDAGEQLVFNYTYDPKRTVDSDSLDEARKYINTTVTQLFYTSNLVHDLYYRYVRLGVYPHECD
jgi:extracellular elastinolytic metalloproteinase